MLLFTLFLAASVQAIYPTVTAHGMGDSCFNSGMQEITQIVGNTTGGYAVCIPTGTKLTDTTNSFFMTMNRNVDKFNENIQKDPKLKGAKAINCVGFSKGTASAEDTFTGTTIRRSPIS